jgi:signal transduction histidine kinase
MLMRKRGGILAKLLVSFLSVSSVPLIVLGYAANKNMNAAGQLAVRQAKEMGARNLDAAEHIGRRAIVDSVRALDDKSTEAIELRTVELANRIADFLYEREIDLLMMSKMHPDAETYLTAYLLSTRQDTVPGSSRSQLEEAKAIEIRSNNVENNESWRHRPPPGFRKVSRPLYKEITFLDLAGREQIKVTNGKISENLIDASNKEETYCKAEDYFSHLDRLQEGEVYVSRVIGPYLKGWLYNSPDGIRVKPESAYAGKENPGGQKFEGIIRWATPVFDQKGGKIGYLTLALDHAHVMEFTDHVVPTEERFSEMPDAAAGNYAFAWDDEDCSISHARQFFICGYDPATGEKVPGWLSEDTYAEYLGSGMTLGEFVKRLPPFREFTQRKRGSGEQAKAGTIPLDCRVLDTAPQCQGWHEGTEDGGSGSFVILWSGLWKLTTYATIPYYTGRYGSSRRGFGYVTIGANVDEFHKAANVTRANIEESILQQRKDIEATTAETRELIEKSSANNRTLMTIITLASIAAVSLASVGISLGITRPLRRLTEVAGAMSRGDLNQTTDIDSRDEIGQLAKSFNEMAATVAEVDKMKSEFVTIASHELRTPIQAMLLGVSGILEGYSGQVDDEVREDLLLACDGIQRLTRLVENLLDLSRIEAGKVEFKLESISIPEIIDRAVGAVLDLAMTHHHAIIKQVPQDLGPVMADRDRIIQVLVNLLSNSIKYTPDAGKVIIRAETEEDHVIISVADNGYGIPAWAQGEVFRKFFQADSVMSHKVGGCGLGLTISKGIVEEHGGSIHCESPVPGDRFPDLPLGGERRGALFRVRLPIHWVSDSSSERV